MNQDNIYEQVAERCSSFSAVGKEAYVNRAKDTETVSCTNCSHFSSDHHCVLDLYDRIVANNNLSTE